MLKTLIVSLALLATTTISVNAQTTGLWSVEPCPNMQFTGSGQHRTLSAYASDDIAVLTYAKDTTKYYNMVRVTHDSGMSWTTLLRERSAARWWGIQHPDHSTYVVVGDTSDFLGVVNNNVQAKWYGVIYYTSDGGQSWTKHKLDSNTMVFDCNMRTSLEGAAIVGHPGNIYNPEADLPQDSLLVTQDGWKTWTARALPVGAKSCMQLLSLGAGSYMTYSFYPQTFYVTSDDGRTWDTRAQLDWGIRRIAAATDQHIFAVGATADVFGTTTPLFLESKDQGRSWAPAQVDRPGALLSVDFADPLNGVAVGDGLWRTVDGGTTWRRDDLPEESIQYFGIRDVCMPKPNFALAVLGQDQLLTYTGGSTLSAPTFYDFHPVAPVLLGQKLIRWTPVVGATAYRLLVSGQVSDKSTYDSTVFRTPLLDTIVTDTSCLFEATLERYSYWGKIEALNGSQHSAWTLKAALFATVSFDGKQLPPQILAPAIGSRVSDSVTILWTSVSGATSYELQVRDGPIIVRSISTPDTFATFTRLPGPAINYIVIRAVTPDDITDWTGGAYYFYTLGLSVSTDTKMLGEVYPVPSANELHVRLASNTSDVRLYLVDLLGARIAERTAHAGEATFDVHALPAGTYVLMDSDHTIMRRVTIIH